MNILELELLSDDLAGTERFYKRVLGLEAKWSGKEYITFHVGYTRLIYYKSVNTSPVYHFAIDIPNNRFNEAYVFIKEGVPLIIMEGGLDVADFVNWDAKSFYFYDNNGNILELITRYPNKANSNKEFTSKSYISVSEIGLVSNDVPRLADALAKQFGVSVFHRQPRANHFTVSGDDEGLFIIAAKGRDWFPTKIKSASFRTRVMFYEKGTVYNIVR